MTDETPTTASGTPETSGETSDPIAPFRGKEVHILVRDTTLREHLKLIFTALKFEKLTVHKMAGGYMDAIRLMAQVLFQKDGLFLVNPPLTVRTDSGEVRKDLPDFFSSVKVLLAKTGRDPMTLMSKCVPVFEDIEFTQRRENVIVSLAEFGVSGAFILKKQESLVGLNPTLRKRKFQDQLMERYSELKDYLLDYLPDMDGALEALKEKQEEMELSKRKAEADKWLDEAEKCKQAGDLDRTIQCLKKAMDIYPDDPEAYLESGRVYVRIRKYSRALKRFQQAGDIAQGLPEPNKEIGNVRILQVTERIERGEDPETPELKKLLDEAVDNYQAALEKASKLKPLHHSKGVDNAAETTARIVGEIFKHDLESLLGKNHPAVKKMSSVARRSLKEMADAGTGKFTPAQLIMLGLAEMDEGRFKEAEAYIVRAMAHKAHFAEACDEMCSLGAVARRRQGPEAALAIYRRLLDKRPPNRPAIYYNMAVAHAQNKDEPQAGDFLVRAVYMNPSLPKQNEFYKNPAMIPIMRLLLELFGEIQARAESTSLSEADAKLVTIQERLETLILARDEKEAFKLLWQAASKLKPLFKRKDLFASPVIMNFMDIKRNALNKASKPELQRFGAMLGELMAQGQDFNITGDLMDYRQFRAQALFALEKAMDQVEAAGNLARAVVVRPEAATELDLYGNQALVNLGREIATKLGNIDRERLG